MVDSEAWPLPWLRGLSGLRVVGVLELRGFGVIIYLGILGS